jgi:hypothetical protein
MKVLKPFTTDGCSDCGISNLFFVLGKTVPLSFRELCIEHDRAYWKGGTAKERLAADKKFRDGIIALGYPKIARVYYMSVRMGGVGWLPTPWRWGYGWTTVK